ncbi:hypothetical protein O7598_13915 [Micromonospora sp. WMMC241]|nr:hypothetical protein [Micromonospora sp. WMMC241]MCZ7437496.1 hypothetical protein [Micromonospora sp. WMMC241]
MRRLGAAPPLESRRHRRGSDATEPVPSAAQHRDPTTRRDLELWERIHDHGIQFADYGISHPGTNQRARGPAPNIRYTDRDTWWTYRAARDGRGNSAIYDLCRALVSADHWPPDGRRFSWGDEQIARRAAGHAGPGTATQWLAWGTSHHLAYVAAQLGLNRA